MARGALKRKPLDVLLSEASAGHLVRTLGLVDLVLIGIGGCVGSGVFSLVGDVAANDSGPAVTISLMIGAFVCLLNCNAYIKLSRAIPSTGSVYAYSYHCLGEVFAVIAASCLVLEYGFSAAAVATSWGSKLSVAIGQEWVANLTILHIGGTAVSINLAAAGICVPVVGILLMGLNMGKLFTNTVTLMKCTLVLFMIVVSLSLFKASNLSPLIPPSSSHAQGAKYGTAGLFTGAVRCFFSFLGFDEICCLAGECKDPKRDLPWAVSLSVAGTAILTFLAALGLVGMQKYTAIDGRSGFSAGFKALGLEWEGTFVGWGEIVTLPVVVFIAFLPTARLFYAMAMDGLVPLAFSRVDSRGVLFFNNALIGAIGIVLALFVDFASFTTMVSAGVLLSFILCNCSLVMLTLKSRTHAPHTASPVPRLPAEREAEATTDGGGPAPEQQARTVQLAAGTPTVHLLSSTCSNSASFQIGGSLVEADMEPEDERRHARIGMLLAAFCASGFACLLLVAGLSLPSTVAGSLSTAPQAAIYSAIVAAALCGLMALGFLIRLSAHGHNKDLGSVWIPGLTILANCFMLATLDVKGFLMVTGYFLMALCLYFAYGIRHSAGNHVRWERASLVIRSRSNSFAPECTRL